MPMVPNAMAAQIISSLNGIDKPGDAINKFWKAICDYVEANALVTYSWVGLQPSVPSPIPDPMVMLTCTIKTSGSLSPNMQNTPAGALSTLSASMNANAATWMIQFPAGFALSPALVIPSIVLTPSGLNNQQGAMNALCTQIIAGLKLATPLASGVHGGFIGSPGASFISIV